jgi:excisionase family DNA binding protein
MRNPHVPDIEFMSAREAAQLLDVSKMTVYRLIHEKKLRAYHISSQFRIDPRDLTDYIKSVSTTE